jgi:predicted transport protein
VHWLEQSLYNRSIVLAEILRQRLTVAKETPLSDIKLFRVLADEVQPIASSAVAVEKSLQLLIERHLEVLVGVRFLASEYATTKSHSGRIDTLGIDESNCPVIIEYKRALNENVINQGLFYLDWLLDHRADFKLLVMEKLGAEVAAEIEWRSPRLVCIAGDFTKYDQHAIGQMPRNIDLIRYRHYGDDLLLLEQIATHSVEPPIVKPAPSFADATSMKAAQVSEKPQVLRRLEQCSPEVNEWYHQLRAFALGLGDNVQERVIPRYIAFRALRNFAYIRFRPTLNKIVLDLSLDEATVAANADLVRSPKGKGRWPVAQVDSADDVARILPLIAQSYQRT